MWPQNFQHTRAKCIIGCLSCLLSTHKWFICPIFSHYKKIHVCLEATKTRLLVTSYLAADMLFRRDDLVHVSSQSGIQWSSLDLTGFRQCIILTGGLRQHLSVHGIRNLEGESCLEPFGLDSFGSLLLCRKKTTTHQHPVPLLLLHLSLQTRTDHVSQLWLEGLHHQISQNLSTQRMQYEFFSLNFF